MKEFITSLSSGVDLRRQPSDYECAYFSGHVYDKMAPILPGWGIVSAYYPERRWNFGMVSYYNLEKRALVIAFRGTESVLDLLSDVGIWHQQEHPGGEGAYQKSKIPVELPLKFSMGSIFSELMIQDLAVSRFVALQSLAMIAASLISLGAGCFMLAPITSTILTSAVFVKLATSGNSLVKGFNAFDKLKSLINKHLNELFEEREKEIEFQKKMENSIREAEEIGLESITFVGHSMGAYIAEMCSCRIKKSFPNTRIKITAVTLDSPGCLSTVEAMEDYHLPDYGHIRSYLSAPNLVNTCNSHAGNIIRVYVPHTEFGWTYSHAFFSIAASLGKAAIYASAPLWFYGGPAGPVLGSALLAKFTAGVVQTLTKDRAWLYRQHNHSNILECFKSKDFPPVCTIMETWPCLPGIISMTAKQIGGFFKSIRPFPDDAPGVRTMFYENFMNELQSQRLPDYTCHKHIGALPKWVDVEKETATPRSKL